MGTPPLSDSGFWQLATETLAGIEAALEAAVVAAALGLKLRITRDGELEIAFADGSKTIFTCQGAAREIRVSASSGVFRFCYDGARWVDVATAASFTPRCRAWSACRAVAP